MTKRANKGGYISFHVAKSEACIYNKDNATYAIANVKLDANLVDRYYRRTCICTAQSLLQIIYLQLKFTIWTSQRARKILASVNRRSAASPQSAVRRIISKVVEGP